MTKRDKSKLEQEIDKAKEEAKKIEKENGQVVIYNPVGTRGIRTSKGTKLVLPGKNIFDAAVWKALCETEDGQALIKAQLFRNLTEEAKKEKK